jgi:AraC-like DNA-binding protein
MAIFPLLQCAGDEGIAPATLLAGTGLDEAQLRDPAGLLPFARELEVVRNYLAATRDPLPGLRASRYYHYHSFGVLGAALVSQPSLLAACRFLVRYVDLTFTPFLVVLEEGDDALEARYLEREDLDGCREFYLLRDLAFIRNLCREACPDDWPGLVRFMDIALQEPAEGAALREFFQWPLRFGAEVTAFGAARAALERPSRFANEMTLQVMQRQCDALLAARRPSGWRHRVEALLLADGPGADPAALAERLCCSERTLRRHLRQEGCSFQEIVLRLQQQRAMHFLRHSRLSVEAIADRLGYSETAAFAHAFKRWTGMTPSRFRTATGPVAASG